MKTTVSDGQESKLQNMKHAQCILFVCLLAVAAACNREPSASQQLDKVESETKSVAKDMNDYTFAQRGEFAAKMQGHLDTLSTKTWSNSPPKSKAPAKRSRSKPAP